MEHGSRAPGATVMSAEAFRDFYRSTLPDVYGYLLRLCAGDRAQAEDLTQEVWLALVEELRHGHDERADVRWLITVARSRFLDLVRRQRSLRSKLELIRSNEERDGEPMPDDVLSCLVDLQPLHRAVLVLRYVDGLTVPEVAEVVDRGVAATNSLLARARAELRRSQLRPVVGGESDG
jgi:RNA polymerase sigma-70 factor (ECF subfamily)